MAGKTDDNIEALEILIYDGLRMRVGQTSDAERESIISQGGRRGEIYAGLKSIRDQYAGLVRQKFPNIPRRVSGYNLNFLLPENGFPVARALVGSEGTCVTLLEATCRLVESPRERVLLVIGCRAQETNQSARAGAAAPGWGMATGGIWRGWPPRS